MSVPQHPSEHAEPVALQGTSVDASDAAQLREAIDRAFDYRGDVTLTLRDGTVLPGYIYDRLIDEGSLEKSVVRLLPADGRTRMTISYGQITRLEFTGRDTAAGKSFETWMKNYQKRKKAGEKGIQIEPERLD